MKTKPYSFVDENGDTLANDIDYAIYDRRHNIIMIIEAKWINKHYNDERYESPKTEPRIVYLAVDKRNQMHINDKHIISEFMLIYFIRKYTKNNMLDLSMLWDEINSLETKVEYISTTEDFYEISVGDKILLVEKNDLYWDY